MDKLANRQQYKRVIKALAQPGQEYKRVVKALVQPMIRKLTSGTQEGGNLAIRLSVKI